MRKWSVILLAVLLPMLSCVGQKDDPAPVVRLVADFTALNVTAGEQCTFTVFSGEEDVTSLALIRNLTDGTVLEGNVFAPAEEGEWTFSATIDGTESEPLTITAIVIADEGKDYFRRSLVLDFTGTWCQNCPKMAAAITETVEARPGRIIPVSVHCLADAMRVRPLCDDLAKQFKVTAYPSAVVDMDPGSLITTTSPELLQSHIDRLLEERGLAAGIRIESTLEGGSLTARVEATLVRDGDYTLALLVVEDGIVAEQKTLSDPIPDYVHNDVLRQWTSSEPFSACAEGDVLELPVTAEVSGKVRLVALVLRGGLVDNVVTCAAGASVDYQYEENND